MGKSLYVVDERAVADAITLRMKAKLLIPEPVSPRISSQPQVRSFRRDRGARSFRLCGPSELRRVSH